MGSRTIVFSVIIPFDHFVLLLFAVIDFYTAAIGFAVRRVQVIREYYSECNHQNTMIQHSLFAECHARARPDEIIKNVHLDSFCS